jgi:hypothetical protein
MSASSVGVSSGSSLGRSSQETTDDVDKFLRKMEMEKVRLACSTWPVEEALTTQKMQALQQRLELASVKASNGWTDMTINEIETVSSASACVLQIARYWWVATSHS